MVLQIVDATSALLLGLNTNFRETYDRLITEPHPLLAMCMRLSLPSTGAYELDHYWESLPHIQIWNRGDDIPEDTFRGNVWSTEILDWGISIPIHMNDVQDSRAGDILGRAGEVATGFAVLRERIFFQLLQAQNDAALLPTIPTCPDGAPLFSATANGAARFGVTGGNTQQGSGVANQEQIKRDFYRAFTRQLRFLDTKGQPQLPETIVSEGYVVIYGVHNEEIFSESFGSELAMKIIVDSAGDPRAATAIQNLLNKGDIPIRRWKTPRIADNSWYICAAGYPTQAIYEYENQAPRDNIADMLNSDQARNQKIMRVNVDSRAGYGYGLPIPMFRTTNT